VWIWRIIRRATACALLGALGTAAAQIAAEEPATAFLEGLRTRGYYDAALDYLDQMSTSPLAPAGFAETIPYERGITLIGMARVERNPASRERTLDEAESSLREFIAAKSKAAGSKVAAAHSQLGGLIAERARMKLESPQKGDRTLAVQEAKRLYQEAFKVFTELQQDLRNRLNELPKELDPKNPQQAEQIEQREQWRADYLQALLLGAAIREETADTAPAGSDEAKSILDEAAKLYGEIHDKYAQKLAGQFALMYRGRSLQKRGALKEALACYSPLLNRTDNADEFRTLKTRTLKLALECLLDPSVANYEEAIRIASPWVSTVTNTEQREPDWLALQFLLAKTYLAEAERLKAGDPKAKQLRTAEQAFSEARQLAVLVSKFPSDYQDDAQELLVRLGRPASPGKPGQIRTFADARDAGRDAIERLRTAQTSLQQLKEQAATTKDEPAKSELQKQITAANETISSVSTEALDRFRKALQLSDSSSPLEDVNTVRYYLAYLYYLAGRSCEAGLVGEFVARRYADTAAARPCAKIALSSYVNLYTEAAPADRQFETQRVVAFAEFAAAQWPDQPEGRDAVNTLVPLLISADRLQDAVTSLAKIPEGTSQRSTAELKLGHALWSKYLKTRRDSPGNAPPDAAALDRLRQQAEQTIRSGMRNLIPDAIDESAAAAILSLAQLEVEAGNSRSAVQILENPQYGPLTLLARDAPASKAPGFAEEACKTALRAYIGTLAQEPSPDAVIAKARGIMDTMQTRLGKSPDGQQRLINIYIGLAKDLETQLENAPPGVKKTLARGFETFLRKLGDTASEANILNWVAETFLSLGKAFDSPGEISSESKAYYEQSIAGYDKLLADPKLNAALATQMRLRRAEVFRHLHDYSKAAAALEEILREKPLLLNVQVEAARTYQEWGAVPGSESRYEQAIMGTSADKKAQRAAVWGWARIAQTTASYAQFKDTFQESRYNLALCRFLWAQAQKGDQRNKLLEAAERDIQLTHRLYGLGDARRSAQYDALLQDIQKARGTAPTGLRGLTGRTETPATASKKEPGQLKRD
jgi:hypothetical protein